MIKTMNVSFHMPTNDSCDECENFKNLLTETPENDEKFAQIQAERDAHVSLAKSARQRYRAAAAEKEIPRKRIFAVDLQKVMLLPYMPRNKSAAFTRRLLTFNETFATIKEDSVFPSITCLWHEAISDRKAPAFCDSIVEVIRMNRDVDIFHFFADYCVGQLKNWFLYTCLVSIVNQTTGPNEIILSYLLKGHTHMAADSVHGHIEKKMRNYGNIYDFREFSDVVKSSVKNLEVIEMRSFHKWENRKRSATRKNDPLKNFHIADIVEVKVTRGSQKLLYKLKYSDEYQELDFLLKKHPLSYNPEEVPQRGINQNKKDGILEKIVIPENRKDFWNNLNASDSIPDLLESNVE